MVSVLTQGTPQQPLTPVSLYPIHSLGFHVYLYAHAVQTYTQEQLHTYMCVHTYLFQIQC